jgi:hypothetical protein
MALSFQTTLALAAASANNIALSQSPGAGAITLNGSTVTAGVATLDTARRILLTSGTSDTGITFTVTGTSLSGSPLTETITGGATTASTTQNFLTVTSVTHTGSVAGTLTIGTSGVGSSPWYMPDRHLTPMNMGIGVVVTGTINYTVEYTYDDPNAPYTGTFPTVFPLTALATKTATTDSSLTTPIYAIRLTQNSFTNPGTAKMIVIQSGLGVQS